MTSLKYKLLRNVFIFSGILVTFIIWLFLPSTFHNTSVFHVGKGAYGSKWGVLLLLPLPLFSLFFRTGKIQFHGDDEEFSKAEQEASDKAQMQCGMIAALALSLLSIALTSFVLILQTGG